MKTSIRATGSVRIAFSVLAMAIVASIAPSAMALASSALPSPDAASVAANAPSKTIANADRIRVALEFPAPAKRTTRNLHTKAGGGDLVEVTAVDARNKPVWAVDFDTKGAFHSAVRLDEPKAKARASRAQAVAAAQKAARSLGLKAGKPDRVIDDGATGGWTVVWDRVESEAVVQGDETRIGVWPDGQLALASTDSHALAARPAKVLERQQVVDLVNADLDSKVNPAWRRDLAIVRAELEWVSPQQSPTSVAAPEAPYVLAWVVDVRASGDTAEFVRQISFVLRADDGGLLGRDIVE